MKRKLILLGLILVLVVLVVAPVAAAGTVGNTGNTDITGQVTTPTISITAPSAVSLGSFVVGDMTGSSSTPGTITVTAGTDGYPKAGIAYSVSAVDNNDGAGKGFMMDGKTQLSTTNKFMISPNDTTYSPADTGFEVTGSATKGDPINLPFYVNQTIEGTEAPGVYGITITFTASIP
jgi:type 1 fimbria pilin